MGVSENRGPYFSTLNSYIVGSDLTGPQNKVPLNFRKLPHGSSVQMPGARVLCGTASNLPVIRGLFGHVQHVGA